LAAANRGRFVVENFQRSPAVPDGLAVMAQAYNMLELPELAEHAVTVLAANHPEYPSLNENGEFDYEKRLLESGNSVLEKMTFGLIKQDQPPAFDTRQMYNKAARDAGVAEEGDTSDGRSVWSWLTFGIMD